MSRITMQDQSVNLMQPNLFTNPTLDWQHHGGEQTSMQPAVSSGSALPKIRKHSCNQCSKTFVRLEHLDRHQRTHTRQKPFQCNQCPRTFARKDLLSRHEKSLHNSTKPPSKEDLRGHRGHAFEDNNTTDRTSNSHISDFQITHHSNEFEIPQAEHQQNNVDFEDGMPLDPLLGNTLGREAHTMPSTHTGDILAIGGTDMEFVMQDSFSGLDWMDALDLSTTTYSSVFHTAQPLWPIIESPEPFVAEDIPLQPISKNFEGTLPKPSNSHRDTQTGRKLNGSVNLFDRIFSRRSSVDLQNIPLTNPLSDSKSTQITSAVRAILSSKLEPLSSLIPDGFTLPSQHALSRYVSGYFDGFHQHLPFMHLPTWSAEKCDIGLFIALCALGARYCFEHETSMGLWKVGKIVVRSKVEERGDLLLRETTYGERDTSPSNSETSVEIIDRCQAMFLLMAFSTWTGDRYLLRQALSFQSALAAMVRQDGLKAVERSMITTWEDWIKYERAKRIKFVIFGFFNLQCLAYDTPPLILNGEIELDLPCEENAWRARSAQEWQQIEGNKTTTTPTFSVLLRELLMQRSSSGQGNWQQTHSYSTFGCYVLIQGLIQHNFQIRQYSRSMFGSESSLPLDQVKILEKALSQWQRAWENNPEASLDPRNPHGPLAFNCTALLRMAYIRLDIDFGPICATLQSGDPHIVAQAMYEAPSVKRGSRLTRAALHACHALLIPVKMGIHLVAHTQVFVWSIQHSVASFECCLLLAKWLLSVTGAELSPPLSEEESLLIRLVQETLRECNVRDVEDVKTLSANVLRAWATVFHGTTVWGVMPLMGTALTIYANLLTN